MIVAVATYAWTAVASVPAVIWVPVTLAVLALGPPAVERLCAFGRRRLMDSPQFDRDLAPKKIRSEMGYDDYFKERTSTWVELLFLRDEAGQGKPQTYWQTTEGHNEAFDLLNALRQAAVDGEVTFRGRKFDYDRPEMTAATVPLTNIAPDYFEKYEFSMGGFVDSQSNYKTFTGTMLKNRISGVSYRDIQANRDQLEDWNRQYREERQQ